VRNPRPIGGGCDARVFTATKAPVSTGRVRPIVAALDGDAGRSARDYCENALALEMLLETARLGSDKLDYLTHNPKASDADLCTRRAAALTTCCGAACSPSNSIPLKWLFRIPLYFVIFRDAAGCARAAKIVRRI